MTAVPAPAERSTVASVLAAVSSMRITVVLLLLLGVLTFAGTLAQEHLSPIDAQREYFESAFVVWDTKVPLFGIRNGSDALTVKVPLPGGYTILLLLFVNLVVGGVVRHRWTKRNLGILVTHLGIGLLLVAGFVKMHWSHQGHVSLFEGASSRTMVSFHEYELALLRREGDDIVERVVPATALEGARHGTVKITDASLPFTVEVSGWLDSCQPRLAGPMMKPPGPVATDADGTSVFLESLPYDKDAPGFAGCRVNVVERVGLAEHSAVLFGLGSGPRQNPRQPYTFTIDGVQWGLDLRHELRDLPFEVKLDKFEKTDHPGTANPRDFSSWVTVREQGGEPRQVHIYMNHPLRSHDHVFFQASWGPSPQSGMQGPPFFSVLEVANNPSDAWPKYASYVVLLGLLWHFVAKLFRFLKSSTNRASGEAVS